MKKIIIFWLCFLFSIVVNAAELEKLTIVLDWFPNPDHAPLIIAQQQGFFKEEGLDVKLIAPTSASPTQQVLNKRVDIGIAYQPFFMEQVDQGVPLISLGTLIDKPLNCLVILKDQGIKNLYDLKGKAIGTKNGEISNLLLKIMLAKQGLSKKDFQLVDISDDLPQALLTHQVDAIDGMMRNFAVPQLEKDGHKIIAFFPEEHGIPNYSELIFITHLDRIKDPRFPRFLAAVKKAVAYLDAYPQETWVSFIKKYPEANNKVNRDAWFATIPYFAEDPSVFDHEDWKKFANFMQKYHLIKKAQPVSRYAIVT